MKESSIKNLRIDNYKLLCEYIYKKLYNPAVFIHLILLYFSFWIDTENEKEYNQNVIIYILGGKIYAIL